MLYRDRSGNPQLKLRPVEGESVDRVKASMERGHPGALLSRTAAVQSLPLSTDRDRTLRIDEFVAA